MVYSTYNKMNTCYELFGIECGDGWKPLYQPIIDYINEYNKDKKGLDRMEIHQIKEKFGGLRVYLNFYDETVRNMIAKAEEDSFHICENCGKHIDEPIINKYYWIYPLCKECYEVEKSKHVC